MIKSKHVRSSEISEIKTIRYDYCRQFNVPRFDITLEWLKKRGWEIQTERRQYIRLKKGEILDVPVGHAVLYEMEKEVK